MDGLREQILINQFVMTSGCSPDQARQYLQASQWQYEVRLMIILILYSHSVFWYL